MIHRKRGGTLRGLRIKRDLYPPQASYWRVVHDFMTRSAPRRTHVMTSMSRGVCQALCWPEAALYYFSNINMASRVCSNSACCKETLTLIILFREKLRAVPGFARLKGNLIPLGPVHLGGVTETNFTPPPHFGRSPGLFLCWCTIGMRIHLIFYVMLHNNSLSDE